MPLCSNVLCPNVLLPYNAPLSLLAKGSFQLLLGGSGGGGSGENPSSSGRSKNGRVLRNSAVSAGRVQRSSVGDQFNQQNIRTNVPTPSAAKCFYLNVPQLQHRRGGLLRPPEATQQKQQQPLWPLPERSFARYRDCVSSQHEMCNNTLFVTSVSVNCY